MQQSDLTQSSLFRILTTEWLPSAAAKVIFLQILFSTTRDVFVAVVAVVADVAVVGVFGTRQKPLMKPKTVGFVRKALT